MLEHTVGQDLALANHEAARVAGVGTAFLPGHGHVRLGIMRCVDFFTMESKMSS